jgi:hypothetical protein
MPNPPSLRSIDASLARSIRRGYFRRLAKEWEAYDQRRGRAAGRNELGFGAIRHWRIGWGLDQF